MMQTEALRRSRFEELHLMDDGGMVFRHKYGQDRKLTTSHNQSPLTR